MDESAEKKTENETHSKEHQKIYGEIIAILNTDRKKRQMRL